MSNIFIDAVIGRPDWLCLLHTRLRLFSVMYPAYAKWVQSHRDLPIKLNQWCNVVVSGFFFVVLFCF